MGQIEFLSALLATGHFWKNEKHRTQIVRIALILTDFLKFIRENLRSSVDCFENCQVARFLGHQIVYDNLRFFIGNDV